MFRSRLSFIFSYDIDIIIRYYYFVNIIYFVCLLFQNTSNRFSFVHWRRHIKWYVGFYLPSEFIFTNNVCWAKWTDLKVLIDNQLVTLPTLCYIWMSFGSIMLVTSFLFLDWKFHILNLPYQYHTDSEESVEKTDGIQKHHYCTW